MNDEDQKRIIVISGPSGAGKSSLTQKLLALYSDILHFSISSTTRAKRPGEIDGVHYHFLTESEFLSLKEKGHFLETAYVHGHYYGTSKDMIEKSLLDNERYRCILDIDVQGTLSVMEIYPKAKRIFILPPSLEELEMRLSNRGDTNEEDIKLRLKNALKELGFITYYNYFIVNRSFETALMELKSIIL